MEARELRIGNLMELPNGEISKVTGFTENGKVWFVREPKHEECALKINQVKPIQLTEEWLLKFGFERDVSDLIIEINNHSELSFDEDLDCYLSIDNGHEWNSTDINIKYVHQLQNLYFALTGEELTIKN